MRCGRDTNFSTAVGRVLPLLLLQSIIDYVSPFSIGLKLRVQYRPDPLLVSSSSLGGVTDAHICRGARGRKCFWEQQHNKTTKPNEGLSQTSQLPTEIAFSETPKRRRPRKLVPAATEVPEKIKFEQQTSLHTPPPHRCSIFSSNRDLLSSSAELASRPSRAPGERARETGSCRSMCNLV